MMPNKTLMCWSCRELVRERAVQEADGFCPVCDVEIRGDIEDDE